MATALQLRFTFALPADGEATTSRELLFILVGVPILRCGSSFGDRRFPAAGEENSCAPRASESAAMVTVDMGRAGVSRTPNSRGGAAVVTVAPPPSPAEAAA